MRRSRWWAWLVLFLGALYFLVPLIATGQFSVQVGAGRAFYAAYQEVVTDPAFWASLRFSVVVALVAVVIGLVIIIPAAYWAHLRVPAMRPFVELLSIMSFVVPPIVLVLGVVRLYGNGFGFLSQPIAMLLMSYGVIALPYLFRSVDNGLRSIDVVPLTEAALSLGAGWGRVLFSVVLPNLRGALLGGAFLVFALIMGEYAIAFVIVWFFVSIMQAFNRGNFSLGSGAR
jgi:putative spermidine/putrescine transport system permease protein